MENWGAPKIRGRGMVKWLPFASVTEQFEEINRMLEEQYKVSKPAITDDTKQRIERALNESLQCNKEINIEYYRNGFIHEQYITVIGIDTHSRTVYCTDAYNSNTKFKIDEFTDLK
ncbi:YolD-like family protein [Bacillus sp. BB56-3]|uniref:YolD-like family protein n=1 Tax=Bacillus sp. BB56-3 TaxID=2217831 RepID=UPI0015D2B61D|nr:YolD-like family protein [Bacillus sp. BB56-3]